MEEPALVQPATVQPVVVHLVRLEQCLRALGVDRLHLRNDPLPADGQPELVGGDLATEYRPNGVLHGGEDDWPGVDQRAVEVEEDDAEAHRAIVAMRVSSDATAQRSPLGIFARPEPPSGFRSCATQ